MRTLLALALVLVVGAAARAEESVADVAEKVNNKLVKIFGAGGFLGIPAYGTGILVSPDGHILTVATQMLETRDLRVHLSSGERYHAKIVAVEPDLDLALLQIEETIGTKDGKPLNIKTPDFFDITAEAAKPLGEPGTSVLAFSNQFNIATRGEPMSVQRGVVAAYSKLRGRRGINQAPYAGDVYFVDAIMCNPGGGGGALVTRDGKQLLGVIGKELRNTLSDTWINYAVPLQAKVNIKGEKETKTVAVTDFVTLGVQGKYVTPPKPEKKKDSRLFELSGIVLVPNVVERTPPYVEELRPDTPATKAGLRPDDLIVYVNGEQVVSIKEFKEALERYEVGEELKIEVRRGDVLQTLTLKVEEPKRKP
ncbi:MAG TPA: trypsin-like peptidase domain-containing protein [Gemmataceae bacterium]|nr:trypsin-like peptidase domain-containing protein [Gemmataceae bacterium]